MSDTAEFYAHLRRNLDDPRLATRTEVDVLRLVLDRLEATEARLLKLERAAGPWDERIRRLHPVTGAVMAAVTSDGDLRKFTLYGPDHPAGWSVTGFYTYGAAQDAADNAMRGRGWTLVGEP